MVYDWVVKWGGAERVLLALHEIFPQAPLLTSVYYPKQAGWAGKFEVKTSFLNRLPGTGNSHRLLAPFMPLAFESLDLKKYRLVISVSSWAAKGVLTASSAVHLNYCLTPTRFLWSKQTEYEHKPGFGFRDSLVRTGFRKMAPYLKRWDRVSAHRPDAYLAISQTVAARLKKFYGVSAEVIYPPVETDFFKPTSKPTGKNWLVVSRLEPYKKVDLVIEVFNRLGWPLTIVGEGSQRSQLERQAGPRIRFTGCVEDEKLLSYYHSCRAVICPQEEDFGLVAVEAQACGRPVLGLGKGGLTETVVPGQTGDLFDFQTAKALYKRLVNFRPESYSAHACRQNALRFSRELFIKSFRRKAEGIWQAFRTGH